MGIKNKYFKLLLLFLKVACVSDAHGDVAFSGEPLHVHSQMSSIPTFAGWSHIFTFLLYLP